MNARPHARTPKYPGAVGDLLTTNVYLTIVAHADASSGVAAGLSLQEISDFAGSPSTSETQRALVDLEKRRKLRVEQVNRRFRTFYVLGMTSEDREEALAFHARMLPKVNGLRAKRAELASAERSGAIGNTFVIPDVAITFENVTDVAKDKRRRFRFDVTLSNIGTIRNCLIAEYGETFSIYGPGRPIDAERRNYRDWFTFSQYLKLQIVPAFVAKLERNELDIIKPQRPELLAEPT
jgi:hypothetical protein